AHALEEIPGVNSISFVLEERVLMTYREKEYIASVKGVDNRFEEVSEVGKKLISGSFALKYDEGGGAASVVMGAGVSYFLGYGRGNFEAPVMLYVPREQSGLDFSSAFASEAAYPAGIFSVQPDFDEKYVLAPIDFVRNLTGREKAINAIEFAVSDDNVGRVKERIRSLLGD